MSSPTGYQITDKIIQKKDKWETLFTAHEFFQTYRHYLVVRAWANTPEEFKEWVGLVESKLRLLTLQLETNIRVKLAHVNPKSFPVKDSEVATQWFVGLHFMKSDGTQRVNIDLTYDIHMFADQRE